MKAEIIATGTEILLGEIVDTNTSFLASELALLGIDIYFNNAVMTTYGQAHYGRLSRGWENVKQSLQILSGTASTAASLTLRRHHYGHFAVIRRFIENVQSGTEPPVTAEVT